MLIKIYNISMINLLCLDSLTVSVIGGLAGLALAVVLLVFGIIKKKD